MRISTKETYDVFAKAAKSGLPIDVLGVKFFIEYLELDTNCNGFFAGTVRLVEVLPCA